MLKQTFPIVTPRLRLRPFAADSDLDALHAIHSIPEATQYLPWQPSAPSDVRETLAKRLRSSTLEAEGERLVLVMVLPETGEVIGYVVLIWVSREHRQGEIGFVLHPHHQGRGLAAEAAKVMLRLGFDNLGLHRIMGRCDARNTASAGLMERLGMRREAHLRESELVQGAWCDELVYGLLDAEWTAQAAPDNSRRANSSTLP